MTETKKEKLKKLLETLMSPEELKRLKNSKVESILASFGENDIEVADRIESLDVKFNEVTDFIKSNRKHSQRINENVTELNDFLVKKLEELKPKDQSNSFKELSKQFQELKELVAINLATLLKEFRKIPRDGGGGGMTFDFVRLSGTVDGSNTIFTIPSSKAIPSDGKIILVWKDGAFTQTEEGDWTKVDGTFTFTYPPNSTPAILYEK